MAEAAAVSDELAEHVLSQASAATSRKRINLPAHPRMLRTSDKISGETVMVDEKQLISKITWRLMPFLGLLYLVAYIDRQQRRRRGDMDRRASLRIFPCFRGSFFSMIRISR
jgi:hypothetical protein